MDAGIVDKHIEAVVPACRVGRGLCDAVGVSNVQHESLNASDTAERFHWRLLLCGFTSSEQHGEISSRKLLADLKAKPAMGASNKMPPGLVHLAYCSLRACLPL